MPDPALTALAHAYFDGDLSAEDLPRLEAALEQARSSERSRQGIDHLLHQLGEQVDGAGTALSHAKTPRSGDNFLRSMSMTLSYLCTSH